MSVLEDLKVFMHALRQFYLGLKIEPKFQAGCNLGRIFGRIRYADYAGLCRTRIRGEPRAGGIGCQNGAPIHGQPLKATRAPVWFVSAQIQPQ